MWKGLDGSNSYGGGGLLRSVFSSAGGFDCTGVVVFGLLIRRGVQLRERAGVEQRERRGVEQRERRGVVLRGVVLRGVGGRDCNGDIDGIPLVDILLYSSWSLAGASHASTQARRSISHWRLATTEIGVVGINISLTSLLLGRGSLKNEFKANDQF